MNDRIVQTVARVALHVGETLRPRHFVTGFLGWLPLLALAMGWPAQASQVMVGPGGDFDTVEDAINGQVYGPGDTITIATGEFVVQQMLRPLGSGSASAPIVVRGAGMGRTIVSGRALSNSKALWDVEQNNSHWIFEDMTVSGMRGAQTNARGMFLVGCEDVILQRLEITDCWNGIMSASASKRVTVQFCDIHHCGGLQGPAHNIYMNSGSDFVIQHNWLHDSQYGLCYKDRTHNLVFRYNRVENADVEGYEISLAGDGSGTQGEALLLGNLLIKSPTSAQQTHFVRFEDGRSGTLRMVHNTLIAQPRNVVVSSIAMRTTLQNNIVVGGSALWTSGALDGNHNWVDSSIDLPAGLIGTLRGESPRFTTAKDQEYHLAPGSPCIDAADASVQPRPEWQWLEPPERAARLVLGAAPDLGAFEFESDGGTQVQTEPWGRLKARYR